MKTCGIILLALVSSAGACPYLAEKGDEGRQEEQPRMELSYQQERDLQAPFVGTPEQAVAAARGDVVQMINNRPRLGPKFVRLSFHDCVGEEGCNGCVDLTDINNAGLFIPMNSLETTCLFYSNQLTRADCWALAGLTAAEVLEPTGTVSFRLEYIGRPTCDAGGTLGNAPSNDVFASPIVTTQNLMDFFSEEFGLTNEQAVALMGAHTLGRLTQGISGFSNSAWVNRQNELDHNFFQLLVGRRGNAPTDRYVQEPAPNGLFFWDRVNRNNLRALQRGRGGRGRRRRGDGLFRGGTRPNGGRGGGGGGGGRGRGRGRGGRNGDSGRDGGNLIMLNSDMALIVDLTDHLIDSNTGEVDCIVGGGVNPCSEAFTFGFVDRFSRDNQSWLNVFEQAFGIMINKGCVPDNACTTGLCTCADAN